MQKKALIVNMKGIQYQHQISLIFSSNSFFTDLKEEDEHLKSYWGLQKNMLAIKKRKKARKSEYFKCIE